MTFGLVARAFLDEYFFNAFEPFEEDRLGISEYHEGVLVSEENCVGIEL